MIVSRVKRFAGAQFKTIIERISFGKVLIKPPDYRGYDYWLRTGSKKYVEDILLQESNEIFNREYVRKIVEEHMKGKKNYDQVICDVLNISLLNRTLNKGFIPKVNVNQGNTLQIISGGGKLFLVEEHIH